MTKEYRTWDKRRMSPVGIMFNNSRNEIVAVNNQPLMQSIGRVDMNGDKIFEGDIVAYNMEHGRELKEKCVVEFFDELAGFAPFCDQVLVASDAYSEWAICDVLIVGNIYENPDIVEKNQ